MSRLRIFTGMALASFLTINAQVTNSFPDDGNVGIGTTSPSSKLHIKDPFGGAAMNIERGGKKWNISIQNTGNNLFFSNSLNSSFFFTLANNGRFGIGTTSPQESLHVVGNSSFDTGNGSSIKINGYHGIETAGNSHWLHLNRYSNDNVSIGHNSTSNVYMVNGGGNVGIGTTSPDSKLTVKGNIHAEEVKVDLSVPGPDYVFEEEYDLKSLEEVQNYIKEHGHLPNIPSAQEMEENGVQLGAMNMKLLEKIEELTLYIIELKTTNETEIHKLKREIQTLKLMANEK